MEPDASFVERLCTDQFRARPEACWREKRPPTAKQLRNYADLDFIQRAAFHERHLQDPFALHPTITIVEPSKLGDEVVNTVSDLKGLFRILDWSIFDQIRGVAVDVLKHRNDATIGFLRFSRDSMPRSTKGP